MEFCENCQKELAVEKYPLHLNYCRRNIKKCSECSRPYDINYEEEHQQEFHQFEICKHCKVQIGVQEINLHMQECMDRPDACVYCELPVPKNKSEEHRAWCEARTKVCEKCSKPVINKEYFDHVGECQGPPTISNPQQQNNFSAYSNYSNTSYSNPTPYYSQSQTIQSSPSQSISSSYSTSSTSFNYQNNQTNPVTRTYTRTYYQNPDGTTYGHQIIENNNYGSSASSSSATATNSYSTSAGSSSNGNVISERVISRRVINHPYTPITSTTGTIIPQQITQPSSYSSQSELFGGFNDEDNDLQIALMASLDCYNENSAELYKQIQEQAALEKGFKK